MYTIMRGCRKPSIFNRTFEVCKVDSFVEAVRLVQLMGAGCIVSSFSKTYIGKADWLKPAKNGQPWKTHKLEPVCNRASMLVMMWLIQRA